MKGDIRKETIDRYQNTIRKMDEVIEILKGNSPQSQKSSDSSVLNENSSVVDTETLSDKIMEKGSPRRPYFRLKPEDVRESVKKLIKGFLEDWDFSKKAKAEPYIHIRRVIERITKEMGKDLI